ncbi:MAG: hypothetical protein ACREIV_03230, partial [Planctomycetaceae bacterium]
MHPVGRRSRALWKPLIACLLALPVSSLAAGCWPNWFRDATVEPVGPPVQAGVSKEELIARLNTNITKVYSWRSTNVDIHARGPLGLPVKLDAQIAVEAPRNFRLRARSFAGDEADFGSNSERFWFWIRHTRPKRVFTARHEEADRAIARLPIPLRPDWLMEVLGVVPIDPNRYT